MGSKLYLGTSWQALNTPLSFHSVLDDEGSNLRQQKLDRQVSKAGARKKGGQHTPSLLESGLASPRGKQEGCALPGVLLTGGERGPGAAFSSTSSVLALPRPWGVFQAGIWGDCSWRAECVVILPG